MKRVLILLSALLALSLLAGCMSIVTTVPKDEGPQEAGDEAEGLDAAWDGLFDSLEDDYSAKAHRWQILDAQGEELYTVSDEEGVAAVDALLQGEGWGLADGEPGQALYTYVFWQQKTLLAGQDPEAEREYEALIRFTVPVEGNEVTLEILPESLEGMEIAGLDLGELLTVRSSVPAETAEALRNPFQWSE